MTKVQGLNLKFQGTGQFYHMSLEPPTWNFSRLKGCHDGLLCAEHHEKHSIGLQLAEFSF